MLSLSTVLVMAGLCASGKAVLLDFYADWCGPCRQMAPVVEQLALQGYPVRKVNVDQHPELAARFGVASIPCFVLLVDGREVGRIVGQTSPGELARMFQSAADRHGSGGSSAPPGVQLAAPSPKPPSASPSRPASQTPAAAQDAGPSMAATQAPASTSLDDHLIAATVRLRVEDPQGRSCGTGTIIDARQGEALILTCGHLFRESQGRGKIEVDLFGPQRIQGIPGRLICYNLERDVALLSIRPPGPVAIARVAPRDYVLAPGQEAISVGCNHGAEPSVVHSRITSINRYLGPPNLQVAGQSVEGRSGGGIFSAEGLVIGVCNAAEPTDNESFCAALAAVHQQLDEAGLTFVYDASQAEDALLAAGQATAPAASGLKTTSQPATPGRSAADLVLAPGGGADREAICGDAQPAAAGVQAPAVLAQTTTPPGGLLPSTPQKRDIGVGSPPTSRWLPEPGSWVSVGAQDAPAQRMASGTPVANGHQAAPAPSHVSPRDWVAVSAPEQAATRPQGVSPLEQALVAKLRPHLAAGKAVVLVIQPQADGSAAAEIVALDGGSSALGDQLNSLLRQPRQLTSLELPNSGPDSHLGPPDSSARLVPVASRGLTAVRAPRPRPVAPCWRAADR